MYRISYYSTVDVQNRLSLTDDADPLPELGGVKQQKDEVAPVEHVGVVEGLEMASTPDNSGTVKKLIKDE